MHTQEPEECRCFPQYRAVAGLTLRLRLGPALQFSLLQTVAFAYDAEAIGAFIALLHRHSTFDINLVNTIALMFNGHYYFA